MTTNNKVTEIFNITNDPRLFFILEKDNHNTTTKRNYI